MNDLLASERAMQMICATMCGSGSPVDKFMDVDRIVDAWVFHPAMLTPEAMLDDLPPKDTT